MQRPEEIRAILEVFGISREVEVDKAAVTDSGEVWLLEDGNEESDMVGESNFNFASRAFSFNSFHLLFF
jgi:hypothetical protein